MDLTLKEFGWKAHFQQQLAGDDRLNSRVARVMRVHRESIDISGPKIKIRIPPFVGNNSDEEDISTVGDWLVLDEDCTRAVRRLKRYSLFKRLAAGKGRRLQLIAANVDTAFIVSSCNLDFNIARIERFLSLTKEAQVMPVVVLTKADLAVDPAFYAEQVKVAMPGVLVEVLNALVAKEVEKLRPWCERGDTVAMLGMSGVGKSTLLNTLAGYEVQKTQSVREIDARGRHTTSARSIHRLDTGGLLIDMPGMREIQLIDAEQGIDDVYAYISVIAENCRFSDCRHGSEPGCAVSEAIEEGKIDVDQLDRFYKLLHETGRNKEALAERHHRSRVFGKMIKQPTSKRQNIGED